MSEKNILKTDELEKISLYESLIIKEILSKKELGSIDSIFVKKYLSKYFSNPLFIEKILHSKNFEEFSRSKIFKVTLKNVRSELRKIYGVFIKKGDREKLLLSFSKSKKISDLNDLLCLHQSTSERINDYEIIYKKFFSNQKNIRIVDLACGLNPLASYFIKDKISFYFASDISSNDCKFIENFFHLTKIPGSAQPLDLTNVESFKKIPSCDFCLLFKALDSLETTKRHISKQLLSSIDAKVFIISFPKVTIGGKNSIAKSKRSWLEKFLQKNNKDFEIFETENELFYIVKNQEIK